MIWHGDKTWHWYLRYKANTSGGLFCWRHLQINCGVFLLALFFHHVFSYLSFRLSQLFIILIRPSSDSIVGGDPRSEETENLLKDDLTGVPVSSPPSTVWCCLTICYQQCLTWWSCIGCYTVWRGQIMPSSDA